MSEQGMGVNMEALGEQLRRVVTANGADGKSLVLIDGTPGAALVHPGGALHEIWSEDGGLLDRTDARDRAAGDVILEPPAGGIRVRWFTTLSAASAGVMEPGTFDEVFEAMGGGSAQVDTSKHPGMHTTHTVDVIAVVSGRVKLILESEEVELGQGDVVIQRGTNHAWETIGDEPAVCLGVLVDRAFA